MYWASWGLCWKYPELVSSRRFPSFVGLLTYQHLSFSNVVGNIYWTVCNSELCFTMCFPVWFKVYPSNSRGGSWKLYDIKKYMLIRNYFIYIVLESLYEDVVQFLHSYPLRIYLFNTFPNYFQRRSLLKILIPMLAVVRSIFESRNELLHSTQSQNSNILF